MPFELRAANIVRDSALMTLARSVAADILRNDPYEREPQNEILWSELQRLKRDKTNFSAIS